ncbi:MAG: endonuclease III [Oscillospiraceae bacterium]|jgi:endonuclease-3|nr:endonuclease III [Oscillospiraceae bacterium]
MTLKEKAADITELLKREYPEAVCSLCAGNPFELLVATRLSAQCTDARVNIVTPALFAAYPTPEAMRRAELPRLEALIRPCGFFHTKARDLIAMAQQICDLHGGEVPRHMEDLTALQGVGRKTANLIRGDVFGLPAIVADTHVIRITNLLGLTASKDPFKVEQQLVAILEPNESNDFCHRIVMHGRAVCVARRPRCSDCVLRGLCAASS